MHIFGPPNVVTSVRERPTDKTEYRTGELAEKRKIVVKTLNMVPEVPLEVFLQRLLPAIPEVAERASPWSRVQRLLERTFAERIKWRGREDQTFRKLERVFDQVVKDVNRASNNSLRQTYQILIRPYATPMSERDTTIRPDAWCVPLDLAKDIRKSEDMGQKCVLTWYDLAVTGECKTEREDSDKATNDNIAKTVYNLQQTMALDPRRRFALAFSISRRSMRLWYANRAVVLTTEPFDFVANYASLVRLFLSLAYARPIGLGWDESMTHVGKDKEGNRAYQFVVNGKHYTSVELLFDHRADNLVGCATRVWRVKSEDGVFVLKDTWLNVDQGSDMSNHQSLITSTQLDQEEREILKSHLVTPVAEEKVYEKEKLNSTTEMMGVGWNLAEYPSHQLEWRQPKPNQSRTQSRAPDPIDLRLSPSSGRKVDRRVPIRHKYQVRTVFREYATPMNKVPSLDSVFKGCADVVLALRLIHKAGYVHRDISVSNVYWYEEPSGTSHGLVGDFEFLIERNREIGHVRTGTPHFMAVEVVASSYLFRGPGTGQHTFRHNHLHDLESIWWILVWVLIRRFIEGHMLEGEKVEQRWQLMEKIFPETMDNTHRHPFFMDPSAMKDCLPQSVHAAVDVVCRLSVLLHTAYQSAEVNYPHIDDAGFEEVGAQFLQILGGLEATNLALVVPKELKQQDAQTPLPEPEVETDTAPGLLYRVNEIFGWNLVKRKFKGDDGNDGPSTGGAKRSRME